MPVVPRLNPQVSPQGLPTVRSNLQVSPDDFGAGFARAGAAVAQVAQREQQKADEALAYEIDNELSTLGNDILFNEQTGALKTKGRNAMGLPDTVGPDFDTRASEIGKKATTPRAKLVFERLKQQRREQVLGSVQRHVLNEGEAYRKEQFTAGAASAINNAGLYYADPARMAAERAKGEEAVRSLMEGQSPEAVEAGLSGYRSKFHAGVLDRMLANKDYRSARAYFGEVKGELQGNDLTGAERAVHEAGIRAEKLTAFDAIVAKHGGDYKAADKAARAIEDPEVREAVQTEVDQHFARQERIEEEAKRDLAQWAWNGALDGNLKGRDDIPADRWASLAPETKKGLIDYWDGKAAGKDVQTDTAVYYGLLDMASNDPEKFQQENLLAYSNSLAPADMKSVIRLQTTGRDDNGTTLFELRSKQQVVADLLTGAGIDPAAKKGKARETGNKFREALDAELKAYQQQTGKKPTGQDIEEIGKKLLIRGYVSRDWLPDLARYRFQASPDQKVVVDAGDVEYADVPVRERRAIEAALAKRKVPVTEANVIKLYVEGLNSGGGE